MSIDNKYSVDRGHEEKVHQTTFLVKLALTGLQDVSRRQKTDDRGQRTRN